MSDKEVRLYSLGEISSLETVTDLISTMPEHKEMLTKISENMPEIVRATSLFGKSQSQFMDNQLTVTHLTPIRNLRQILAEVEKTKSAIKEQYIKLKRKEVEIKILQRDYDNESDDLKADLIHLDMCEKNNELEQSKTYVSGAIRKITNYMEQYNSIKENHNIGEFNESDFEKEEEEYHISKAFQQGMCAARSHNGNIDEGNQIYFEQLGINGTVAQHYVSLYLNAEKDLLRNGKEPSYNAYVSFIEDMIGKFKGCSAISAEHKGMTGKVTEIALISKGLIENK